LSVSRELFFWLGAIKVWLLRVMLGKNIEVDGIVRLSPRVRIEIDKTSNLKLGRGCKVFSGQIIAKNGSKIVMDDGLRISGKIEADKGSKIYIRSGVVINGQLSVGGGGRLEVGEKSLVGRLETSEIVVDVFVDGGMMKLGKCVKLEGNVGVRFGGVLLMGDYSGIGEGSKILCDDQITIGGCVLISYDVSIYDTNTHTIDWKKRHGVIVKSFPKGAMEINKPETKGVEIGDDVWIGERVSILKGSKIGRRSVIGTNCVVSNMKIPANSVVTGNKAKIVRKI